MQGTVREGGWTSLPSVATRALLLCASLFNPLCKIQFEEKIPLFFFFLSTCLTTVLFLNILVGNQQVISLF